jgi:predicted nucleic acid-binding protein
LIVVDASAALSALLNDGPARQALAREQLHAPHLLDAEVANGLRRHVASGQLTAEQGLAAVRTLGRLAITRYPVVALLERIWHVRANFSAYDASYVALAEALGCPVLTADARIARAPGLRCVVVVVPR